MTKPLEKPLAKPQPRHIAIIMDGNRRWAEQHRVACRIGHRKGIEAARRCVEACAERGIEYLTLFAFSSENWKRPKEEVEALMGLLRLYLNSEMERLAESKMRLRFIGERDNLPSDITDLLSRAEEASVENPGMLVTLAINYGSHFEILRAVRTLARRAARGEITPDQIGEQDLARALETSDVPDPDLVIRTGGEKRLSNFLLWQSAYSELVFLNEYWPDFDEALLEKAIAEYQARERRYGARD